MDSANTRPLLVTALLLMLIAAGCGRQPEPTPTPTATPSPVAVTLATPEPAAADGQIVATLEPVNATAVPDTVVAAGESNPVESDTGQVPVVVQSQPDCTIESNLDLAGFPDLEASMGCAVSEGRTDPVGFNEFGEGPDYNRFMLWLSWENQIYVLAPAGDWQAYPDTWTEDDPTFACNPMGGDPSSPPLPRRGFGKLWCENAAVRDALGLVEVEERLCQHTVTQEFENGRVIACFEDATIRYYKLFNDRRWEAVLQP